MVKSWEKGRRKRELLIKTACKGREGEIREFREKESEGWTIR